MESTRKPIGQFLVEKKVLTPEQVEAILTHSKAHGLRFGEAGMALGLLTREKLMKVFGPGYAVDFFYVSPKHFPDITKAALSTEDMIQFGALPLGYKKKPGWFRAKKMLNIGFLNPSHAELLSSIAALAHRRLGDKAFDDIKVYLILADQFLETLKTVYGITETEIRSLPPKQVNDTLQMFLTDSNSPPQN